MTHSTPRCVLVIDDDADTRQRLTSELRARSLVTDEAANERDAVELLSRHRYAVMLLALVPGADRLEVLELLDPAEPPPVVLVLAEREPRLHARLGATRVHGVVRKPFDPCELAELTAECARNLRSVAPARDAGAMVPRALAAPESVLDQA